MKQFCLFLLLTANFLHAQKRVKKSIINPEIAAITIDAANIFKLSVATAQGNEMILEATLDGEYKNDLLLNVRESGNTLLVSTDFPPAFRLPGDKLSAHKVISVALKVILPERKRIRIFGTGCNITAKGIYHNLEISLSDGSCLLENISGNAKVATQSGTIHIRAARAKIKASSKYGVVTENPIPFGDNRYDISSVTGNIFLNKTD